MKNAMRWAAVAMLGLFVGAPGAHAEGGDFENSLKEGRQALQFGVDKEIFVRPLQGTTLSYLKHTADARAWRLGLDLLYDHSSGRADLMVVYPVYGSGATRDTTISERTESPATNTRISLGWERLYYSNPVSRVNMYWATGPLVRYFRRTSTSAQVGGRYGSDLRSDAFRSLGVGWSASMGVEWFWRKEMSLQAEYGAVAEYAHQSYRYQEQSDGVPRRQETRSLNDFNVSSKSVRLGLSVYFE